MELAFSHVSPELIFFCLLGSIHITQFLGTPLYLLNREWYYAWMAMTKKYFALTTTVMTHIWGPTTVRISGDATVAGQIKPTAAGGVEFNFPHRLVLIANHQVTYPRLRGDLGFGILTSPDLYGLVVPLVDWLCQCP